MAEIPYGRNVGMEISEKQLKEWEELANAATPGPWYPRATDDNYCMNARYVSTVKGPTEIRFKGELLGTNESGFVHDGICGMGRDAKPEEVVAITLLQQPDLAGHAAAKWDDDTFFIAAAREAIPALIAEVRELRELLKPANTTMTDMRGTAPDCIPDDVSSEDFIRKIRNEEW